MFFTKYKKKKDLGKAAVMGAIVFFLVYWVLKHILAVGIIGLIAGGLIWYFFGGLIVLLIASKALK